MTLYTVIGEYDVLYAQDRELKGLSADASAQRNQPVLSTNPRDFLGGTVLSSDYTKYKTKEEHYNEYY